MFTQVQASVDDRLTLSAYIDHVLTHHFNQCEDAIKSLYARNYNSVF